MALEQHTKDEFFKALRSKANAATDPLLGFFDDYLGKGRPGNPYPHQKNGWFGKKPSAGGGGGGDSGMGKLTGGGGAKTSPSSGPPTQESGPPSIGTANTIQAPAPAVAGTPTPSPAGPPTAAGKAPAASDSGQKTGVGIAPKRAQANQERRAGMQQAAGAQQDAAVAGLSAKLGGDAPAKAGEAAYFQHRDQALAGGASEAQAHEIGKQRGSEAWDQAVSARQASKLPSPTSSGRPNIPGGVSPPTQQSGPPTGMGPPKNPTSIPLSPMTAGAPVAPSLPAAGTTTPGAPPAGMQPPASAPAAGAGAGAKPGAGGKPAAAGGMNPWSMYGVGSGIGGGMFTPGGTVNATAGGAVGTAHSLLHGGGNQQQKPAAVGRAARVDQVAKPPKAPKPKGGGQSSMQVSP